MYEYNGELCPRAVVLSSINSLSVKFSTRVALIFTITKVAALGLVIALGFYHLIFTGTGFRSLLDSIALHYLYSTRGLCI